MYPTRCPSQRRVEEEIDAVDSHGGRTGRRAEGSMSPSTIDQQDKSGWGGFKEGRSIVVMGEVRGSKYG